MKNEKNISEHDYTCIHVSGEYSTTHANVCDELDIVFDEWCHDLITHTPWRPWPFYSICMKSSYSKVLFV